MIDDFFSKTPYELSKDDKVRLLTQELTDLTLHHKDCCKEYASIIGAYGFDASRINTYYDLPFIPVRLFKEYDLKSIKNEDVFKTMTSSGTTGQKVSKIFVDRDTASNQQKTLIKIMSDFIGKQRLPMLIIDSPKVVKDRSLFSARGAAILGLSMLARERVYALDENMDLQLDVVREFCEKYKGQRILIFGFTFMVWQHLYSKLKELNVRLDLPEAFLITGGGWKKLVTLNISRDAFKNALREQCGIGHFLDHYGMVEQTGSIYAECECGHLHASIYSDVIIRNPKDFSVCDKNERGIIQVVSVLPYSYPGHSLLTEDEGIILGEDDCPCGRKGKYFMITGRMKKAELRGCSDTYADKF